jgi:hypothetical protein
VIQAADKGSASAQHEEAKRKRDSAQHKDAKRKRDSAQHKDWGGSRWIVNLRVHF